MRGAVLTAGGLGAAALIGCGDDDDDDDGGATMTETAAGGGESTSEAGQPKTGGSLRVVQTTLDTMDPATAQPTSLWHSVYEWLVVWKQSTEEAVPNLAESWEQQDASTIVFHMDPAAKWQNIDPLNGRQVTSEDIKYSMEYYVTDDPRFQWASELDAVDVPAIDTPDPTSLTFHLKRPFVPQLTIFYTTFRLYALPREVIERDGSLEEQAIGSGPFILETYDQTDGVKLVRNADYWKPGLPYIDDFNGLPIQDVTAQFAAFQSQEIDTLLVTVDQIPELPSSAVLLNSPDFIFSALRFNTTREPFGDQRVRRALHLAIDREALNQIAYAGESQPSGPVSPVYGKFALPEDELLQQPGYRTPKDDDLAEAKKLLMAAGAEDLKATVAGGIFSKPMSEVPTIAIVDQLAQIGVDVTTDITDFATYNRARSSGDFELLGDAQAGTGDPDSVLRQSYLTGGSRNYGSYSNSEIDSLIEAQSIETDEDQRVSIIHDIQRKLLEDAPLAAYYHNLSLRASQDYVRGLEEWHGPVSAVDTYAYGNAVWLDK